MEEADSVAPFSSLSDFGDWCRGFGVGKRRTVDNVLQRVRISIL